jgi:hypothetical protein
VGGAEVAPSPVEPRTIDDQKERFMTKALTLFVTVAVTALVLAAGASADGPTIQTLPLIAANVPWGPSCGAEPIIASFTGTRRVESFFDGSTLVLQRRHVRADGTITLRSTGVTLPYDVDFTFTLDLVAQTGTITGQQAHVILPGGGGVVFRNSGRIVEDISEFPPPFLDEAGVHDYFDPGGRDEVCAALGAGS